MSMLLTKMLKLPGTYTQVPAILIEKTAESGYPQSVDENCWYESSSCFLSENSGIWISASGE